jgi:FkbM family methyltransferase
MRHYASLRRPTVGSRFSDVIGEVQEVDGRSCIVSRRGEVGHLLYGAKELTPSGRYRIDFDLALVDALDRPGDPVCVTLDVAVRGGQRIVSERFLTLSELDKEFQRFTLDIEIADDRWLEYRVATTGQVEFAVAAPPGITRLGDASNRSVRRRPEDRAWDNEAEFLDGFLRNVSGLIHIGANIGQERQIYRLLGLDVLWVEAMPDVHRRLLGNIVGMPRQRALQALLTDVPGQEHEFHVANNSGSSSLQHLDQHAHIFPDIQYVERLKLTSTTLGSLLKDAGIQAGDYQAITLDVEGAELLVLNGAGAALDGIKYIKVEVADFTPRVGSPTTAEIDDFLRKAGFAELARRPFAVGPEGNGTYWDIVWKRPVPGEPLHRPGVKLPLIMPAWDITELARVHD